MMDRLAFFFTGATLLAFLAIHDLSGSVNSETARTLGRSILVIIIPLFLTFVLMFFLEATRLRF